MNDNPVPTQHMVKNPKRILASKGNTATVGES
jgi:hypothetical protein